MAVKFTKNDVDAVANSRYFRNHGIRWLMLWGIIIMGIGIISNYVHVIPYYVYYLAWFGVSIYFMLRFSKNQSSIRKQLWDEILSAGIEVAQQDNKKK